jgi:hypothetical protein
MKLLFILITACLVSVTCAAAILTVSNNATFPAQYTTVQAAINAAAAGDTIYIYPSPTMYNEYATISKKLTLIGTGSNPQRPTKMTADIFMIIVDNNAAAGTALLGLNTPGGMQIGNTQASIDGLILSDCKSGGDCYIYGNNMLIENCIITNGYSTGNSLRIGTPGATGNVIQNNYIHGTLSLSNGTNTIVRNNIFASGDANTFAFAEAGQNGTLWGFAVQVLNNIFYKSNPNSLRGIATQCMYKNNIYYLTTDPPPVNALSSGNVNANPLFVNFPVAGAIFSFDYDFHLQPLSPGINYGTDGKDVGMWGGLEPVNTGFEPPVPKIYEFSVNNSTVPVGGTLQVTLKASKAH